MYACNVVLYNKKRTFGPHPISGTEFLMPLEFPVMRAIKVSLIMLKRWFLESTQGTLEPTFQFHPPILQEGKGEWLRIEFSHQGPMI